MPVADTLTERQQKWFASVREGLVRETGRSLDDWVALAHGCPETAPRKRVAWMKATYGLGQNRAMMVLNAAFPPENGWSEPATLAATLWADPSARAIHEAVRCLVLALPDVLTGQRKGFTAYSRRVQFCALRPAKQRVLLGLALDPGADPLLQPAGKEAWSERLHSLMHLTSPDLPAQMPSLLNAAWERS